MFNVPPTHFDAFLNATAKVLHDSSTLVLWDVLHSINDSSFQLLYVLKIITTEFVFQNPHKWKLRGLKSGLFALHGWRVLRLMHLVPKWFEIHCSTSLDTLRVPPHLAGTTGVVVLWPRSLVEAVSRSEIRFSKTGHYYWLRLVLRAHLFEKYSSGSLYLQGFLMKLHNLLYVTIFITDEESILPMFVFFISNLWYPGTFDVKIVVKNAKTTFW